MRKRNGMFPLEETCDKQNHLLDSFWPQGDLQYLMSGRCGIYHCLLDILQHDSKRVAYLPLYTCETVVAPYVKAGFKLKFYSFDRNMTPIFEDEALDEISLINICGYYGFSNYDKAFVKKCHERGIIVMEDMTHSVLSKDALDENCDYAAGSLRKWMGVACGGFALKRSGKFNVQAMPPHEQHLKLRYDAINNDDNDVFWEGEMLLRQIFDDYASDDQSRYIMDHVDYDVICQARRENYQTLLDNVKENPAFQVVFPVLDENSVPSHFTILAEDRKKVQAYLKALDIKNAVYWPQGPYIVLDGQEDTAFIYEHVVSICCDQRYTREDMLRVAEALNNYR